MWEWRFWRWALVAVAVISIAVPVLSLVQASFWDDWVKTAHPMVPGGSGKPDDATQWQLPGAWGFHAYDVINSILLFVTLLYVIRSVSVAEAALNKSHHSYVQALVDSRYDAMDKLYFDLLRERREKPYSADADDPYALMVWNFIETIIDKCEKDPSGELMKTWAPLISAEARNFGNFVEKLDATARPANSAYFKNEFILLARALVPASKSALDSGNDLDGAAFLRLFRSLKKIADVAKQRHVEASDRWLKAETDRRRFTGFATEEDFLATFARIHAMDEAKKQATNGWDIPRSIRHDDLKNNELAREDFVYAQYGKLILWVLNNASPQDLNGPAPTPGLVAAAALA